MILRGPGVEARATISAVQPLPINFVDAMPQRGFWLQLQRSLDLVEGAGISGALLFQLRGQHVELFDGGRPGEQIWCFRHQRRRDCSHKVCLPT